MIFNWFNRLNVKNRVLSIMVTLIVAACASPKLPYYFSWRTLKESKGYPDDSIKNKSQQFLVSAQANSVSTQEASLVTGSQSEELYLNEIIIKKYADKDLRRESIEKVDIITVDIKRAKEWPKDDTKTEGGKKGGWAVAGFVLSILSVLASPVAAFGAGVLVIPVAAIGVIMCLVGLKSKRRKLAIAGLIIGSLGLVFAIIATINFLSSGGWD